MSLEGSHAGARSERRFRIRTYGCQMNVHDSEKIANLLLCTIRIRIEGGQQLVHVTCLRYQSPCRTNPAQ